LYYDYVPLENIEDLARCPVEIISLDKRGRHGWGFVVFKEEKYQARAHLKCNGVNFEASGVSICQSKSGLIQEMNFVSPMVIVGSEKCEIKSSDKKRFRYRMPKGVCVFTLARIEKPHLKHLHYTIGYDESLLRE